MGKPSDELSSVRDEIAQIAPVFERINREYVDVTRRHQLDPQDAALGQRFADIQNERHELDRALTSLQTREREWETRVAEDARVIGIEERKAEVADSSFWNRRLPTSLALVNAAAFALIANKTLDPQVNPRIFSVAWLPMGFFGLALALSGSIPIAIILRRERLRWWLTGATAIFMIGAMTISVWAIWYVGRPVAAAPAVPMAAKTVRYQGGPAQAGSNVVEPVQDRSKQAGARGRSP